MTPASAGAALPALLASLEEPWLRRLAPESVLARIRAIAATHALGGLPRLVFECPIDRDEPLLDVSLGLPPAGLGGVAAARAGPGDTGPWARIAAFCRECAEPDSLLARHVACAWLEYDTGVAGDSRVPSFFFELDNSGGQRHRFSGDPGGPWAALVRGVEILRAPPAGAPLQALERCARALPEEAGVLGIGVMLSRAEARLRFCANLVPVPGLSSYLEAIHWTGSLASVAARVPQLPGYEAGCRLAFDVDDGPGDRLGVELIAQPSERFREARDWHAWLDALARQGLCTERKREALLGWLEGSMRPAPGAAGTALTLMDISHVKLVFAGSEVAVVKAYPYAEHLPQSPLLAQAAAWLRGDAAR